MPPTYWFWYSVAKLIARTAFSLRVVGRENLLPFEGRPLLLASNHQSYLDPPMVGVCCPWGMYFLARKSLFERPVMRSLLPKLQTVPIDQHRPDASALRQVVRLLRERKTTLVFPEGTRSPDGRLQGAQPGVGLIIAQTLCPVVPVRIRGTFEALPRRGQGLRFVPVTVTFGPALSFDQDALTTYGEGRERYQRIGDRVVEAIAAL